MRTPSGLLAALVLALCARPAVGQDKLPPDRTPHLVLTHGGPHAPVNALAFAPDASALYVAGFDKQVRRYKLTKDGKYDADGEFRVPIGPGNAGVVNAVAVSPDGKWVAVAGRAPIRGENWGTADDGTDEDARRLPTLLREDSGVVYLFDPAKPDGGKVIRGQRSEVRALAFANPAPASGPVLVTAGIEWNEKLDKYAGTVRVFDVTAGAELAARADLPATAIRPGVAAWATGAKKDGLRVAVAWDGFADGKLLPSKLLTWDNPRTNGGTDRWEAEALFISPLAVRVGKDGGATELLTGGYDRARNSGGLNARPAVGGEVTTTALAGDGGRLLLPTAIAALTIEDTGDATALLLPTGSDANGPRYDLRLLLPKAERNVALTGFNAQRPVLAASPDGRYVAVAGFKDNRVEVYDAAQLAAGKPAAEKLTGDARGFRTVAFFAGEKLWLGSEADTPNAGGVVLDLARAARTAGPRGANDKLDAPAGGDAAEVLNGEAFVTIGGKKKPIPLPAGHRATAAAFLPGKPAWDATLGPLVAVAHVHEVSQTVLVTLFDADTAKPLFKLGGPTLPVRSLAFSGSRALLAGAGDDGTVVLWSLKNVAKPLPAIEGLLVSGRGDAVVVASVQANTPSAKFAVGEVIESVADAKGVQQPVKAPLDFILAVRALKVGAVAQVKVKGKPAVAVAVGAATGFRHPLFTLWVNPVAKAGAHDWVGWTSSGPYDASGAASEARIGWLSATGNPARPATFAGANQYRKLFYKRDFLRLLLTTADYTDAVALLPPPLRPKLVATLLGPTAIHAGRTVARAALDGIDVSLTDLDETFDLDGAELHWRITGPGGAGAWQRVPFAAGRTAIDLRKHEWARGEHRAQLKLLTPGSAAPVHEVAAAVWFVPPAPALAVKLDGKPPAADPETMNDEVEITALVDAKANPAGAAVTLSWTDAKPVELPAGPGGTFLPAKVKLKPQGTTTIQVTATNRGDGVVAALESTAVTVRVRKLAPKVVPPPAVKLLVVTPYDFRTVTDAPYVVSTPAVTFSATVQDANPITAFEWKVGDGEWTAGKLDPKTHAEAREIALPATGAPLVVRVRAKSKDSEFAVDSAEARFDGLPDVTVAMPPAVVSGPELKLAGGLKIIGRRPFKILVLVTSARTGQTRAFDPTPDPTLTKWEAGVTLFPGENQLGYVVKYDDDRKELRRAGLIDVRYVRPPVVAGAAPIEVGTGAAGDVALAVLSPADAPPSELWVNGARVAVRTAAKPVRLFGATLWPVAAAGVPVNPGADRLKPVAVVVRNAEAESRAVSAKVSGREEVKVPPPAIRLMHQGGLIASGQELPPVSEPGFAFDLSVTSEAKLTRVEVWHGRGANSGLEAVGALRAGGLELAARPALKLRPGTANYVRVVASNSGGTTTAVFNVSYVPPPVRVVIDTIKEPNGKPIALSPGSTELAVAGPVIDVEGRVLWTSDDDPVARDRDLTVTFVANGVAHVPVPVKPAAGGDRVRTFAGRVHLNTLDPDPKAKGVTRVRADLRSGSRVVPVPQEGLKQAGFTVTSSDPHRRQRLHVLLVGVDVPTAHRKELVRRVVKAVGGELPADGPNFTEGRFPRAGFEFAYLYSPRLGYTKAGDLTALLSAARIDIERRAKRADEDWVNDVIVVYYLGEDWMDAETGQWLLHSATTLSGAAGKRPADHAIRLDNLPQIPGMPVAVFDVAGGAKPGDDLRLDLAYLRCARANALAPSQLPEKLASALAVKVTLGGIAEYVGKEALNTATKVALQQAGDRPFGRPKP